MSRDQRCVGMRNTGTQIGDARISGQVELELRIPLRTATLREFGKPRLQGGAMLLRDDFDGVRLGALIA